MPHNAERFSRLHIFTELKPGRQTILQYVCYQRILTLHLATLKCWHCTFFFSPTTNSICAFHTYHTNISKDLSIIQTSFIKAEELRRQRPNLQHQVQINWIFLTEHQEKLRKNQIFFDKMFGKLPAVSVVTELGVV